MKISILPPTAFTDGSQICEIATFIHSHITCVCYSAHRRSVTSFFAQVAITPLYLYIQIDLFLIQLQRVVEDAWKSNWIYPYLFYLRLSKTDELGCLSEQLVKLKLR